jgi:transposase
MKTSVVQVGIDVAKADLQVATLKQSLRLPNTPAGHRRLLAWLRTLGVVHVVCEATGVTNVNSWPPSTPGPSR